MEKLQKSITFQISPAFIDNVRNVVTMTGKLSDRQM
jgi:hypothetical protein